MPTIDELLQLVDQAIAYNAKEPEDFESSAHLQAEMSCVAENAGILATALRERLVAEQQAIESKRRFIERGCEDDPVKPSVTGKEVATVATDLAAQVRELEENYGEAVSAALRETARAVRAEQSLATALEKPWLDKPTEPGWYWYDVGDGLRPTQVFIRPGHSYLCIQDPSDCSHTKRNFLAVAKLPGKWLRIAEPARENVTKPG